jgi:hypothetical protein
MPTQFDPPSGTRDFLAREFETRERAFALIRSVFARYGFEPLATPAFERLDVLMGKYGEEGDKLIFKILRRGEHEGTGEADLALRYDLTVPLARVAAAYGSQLPVPYKRYAIGPVWRADRPGRGRYREFTQCDLDTLGSTSALADAEVISAVNDVLAGLGIGGFRFSLNSRRVLAGLLEAFAVPPEAGSGVLITLDKLDKLAPAEVAAELAGRGLPEGKAAELVAAMTADDAAERISDALKSSEQGSAGGAGLARRRRALRPPHRPARRAGRARDRRLARHRADPAHAAARGGGAHPAGCGGHGHGPALRGAQLRVRRGRPVGRAARQCLPGSVRQARPAAQMGQRPGGPLVADLRRRGGRGRDRHRPGHGHR